MVRISAPATLVVVASLGAVSADSTSPLPNWVGPKIGRPIDTACYRKTLRSFTCPLGYDSDKLGGCWAQCPLEYPVACGMECIPQSKDCGIEVITKIGVVADVAIKAASNSMISGLIGMPASMGIQCGGQLFTIVTKIVVAVGDIQQATPDLKTEQLVAKILQLDLVSTELPAAIVKCAGANSSIATTVTTIVKKIVELIASRGKAVLAPAAFLQLTKDAGIGAPFTAMSTSDLDKFKQLIANGPACGMQLVNVLTRIVKYIVELKKKNTAITPEQIRVELTKTALFLSELPKLTSQCAASSSGSASGSAAAFDMRDLIRKALQGFIDKVIEGAYQNGNPVPPEYFALVAVELGLDKLSGMDSFGIVALVKEFLQPICGPTSMIGEIDDGPAAQALGLRAVGAAFNGSAGQWKKAGNGQVKIFFESKDTQDVTVNVWSGGTQIASVPVGKGKTVEWTKPVADLQDKTLYLDRWRPGFLGLPGTGGGSLLTWVPRSSAGGNFELHATLSVS
jgi:hypothetical protein